MAATPKLLTDAQRKQIAPLLPEPQSSSKGGAPISSPIAAASRGFYGFCGPGRNGVHCRRNIPVPPPAGGA